MTETSVIATDVIRRSKSLRLKIPKLRIGASLAAMFGLFGDAITMAYVEPYTIRRRGPQNVPDEALGGRDPDW